VKSLIIAITSHAEEIELSDRLAIYGKKLLSLSLIFNSLLSIFYAVGLLSGYHADGWTLYPPYLISGALFWALILASIINIFPSATMGQVKTGRLWFHHYIYGFLVSTIALVLIVLAPISPLNLFTANTMNKTVNLGRFLLLGGLTLILDDLPDVSNGLRRALFFLRQQAYRIRKLLHITQYMMGCFSAYLFTAVVLHITQNPQSATIANFILSATLAITSLFSFAVAKRKIWLQIIK
jgi:hypothetical protein